MYASARSARRRRVWVLIGAALEVIVGVAAAAHAFTSSLSFFGQSTSDAFHAWVLRPVMVGGVLTALLGLVSGVVAVASGERPAVPVTVLILAVVPLVFGTVAAAHRDNPGPFERLALSRLHPPPGSADARLTVGAEPPDVILPGKAPGSELVAGPPPGDPDVGVLSWRLPAGTGSCASAISPLARWVDRASLRSAEGGSASGCRYFARYKGWTVFASTTLDHLVVVLGPPPDQL